MKMSRPQANRIQVPDELREVLLEFTISYLLEQPGDIINYAVDYFTRLRESRVNAFDVAAVSSPDDSVISNDDGIYFFLVHFKCIFVCLFICVFVLRTAND